MRIIKREKIKTLINFYLGFLLNHRQNARFFNHIGLA